MPYTPLAVANEFIDQYGHENRLDHMKLQKLTYYTNGWWLADHDDPLTIEAPQVWKFGPVFPSLYNAFAPFGSRPITEPQRPRPAGQPPRVVGPDAAEALNVIHWVWGRYGQLSAIQLSELTHAVGSPWQTEAEARNYEVPRGHPIPTARIKEYFEARAQAMNPA